MNRVAIVGGRDFDHYELMFHLLDKMEIDIIVSGGAPGADSLAERYANDMGIKTLIFKAEWDKYGKSAGFIRNKDIIDNCDSVVAFWDGSSKGTLSSINLAKKQRKEVKIIMF